MKSLLSLIALIGVASCLTIGAKDGSLDPGKITWWKEKWSISPIEISQTNAAGVDRTLTFNFRPSTTIDAGIVQVTFPDTLGSGQTVQIYSGKIVGDTDMSGTTSYSFSNTQVGVYGPFAIVTRSSSTGQIVDANTMFGCIATTDEATTNDGDLDVTTVGTLTTVSSVDGLYFAFTVTQSLWKHDIIQIITDSDWTAGNSLTCSSETIEGVTNLLKGPDDDHNLPCAVDDDGVISIYGLSNDVLVTSSLAIKIKVSSFTYPMAVQSSFSWTLNLWRWGTKTLIAQWTGDGPVTTTAGAINYTSWAPVSSLPKADILSGMTLFMKLTFSTEHKIPAGGKVVVTFASSATVTGNWYADLDGTTSTSGSLCHLPTYIEGASCVVTSANVLTITFTRERAAGSLSVIALTTFSSTSSSISSIQSKTSADAIIDKTGSSVTTLTYGSKVLMADFKFFAYDNDTAASYSNGLQEGGSYTDRTLWFALSPHTSGGWSASTTLEVNLDYSDSEIQYFTPYIDASSTEAVRMDVASATILSTALLTATNTYTLSDGTITATMAHRTPTTTQYLIFGFYGEVALPLVASNKATLYEVWATTSTTTTGTVIDIGTYVYSVLPKLALSTEFSTKPLCTATLTGIPLVNTFTALDMDFDFSGDSYSYIIEITISGSNDLETGLESGSNIPYYTTSDSDPVVKLTYSTDAVITITDLGSIDTDDDAVLTFISNAAVGDSTSTSVFYFTDSSQPDIRNILYKNTYTITRAAGTAFSTNTPTGTLAFDINDSADIAVTLKSASSSSVGDYIGVSFPSGFDGSAATLKIATAAAPSDTYSVTSPGDYFFGAFVIGVADADFAITTSDQSLTISGVTTADRVNSATSETYTSKLNVFSTSSVLGSACTNAATLVGYSIATGTISDVSFTPDESTSGYSGIDITVTITFTTVNKIPEDGTIEVTLDSSWTWPSDCSAGLSSIDSSSEVNCEILGTTLTVSNFAETAAGQITITIDHVLAPTSTNKYATDIYTMIGSYYIDTITGIDDEITITEDSTLGSTSTGMTIAAYPNEAGLDGVDAYITFSLTKTIPADGVIEIEHSAWTYTDGNSIKDYCWSNIDYKSCTFGSSKVVLTLSKDLTSGTTVQLYLDAAVDLPDASGASTVFKVTSSWNERDITEDTVGKSITVVDSNSVAITVDDIVLDISNAGELAAYTFTFSSAAAVDADDTFWIVFPRDFDAYIGEANNFLTRCEASNFFMTCDSDYFGDVDCVSDHWHLILSGLGKDADADENLDITVYSVKNPQAGETEGVFQIFHFGSDGNVKASIQVGPKITTTDAASSGVDLKEVFVDSAELTVSTTYTFDFYLVQALTGDNEIVITFPQQFNLQLTVGSTASCSSVYFDESGDVDTDAAEELDWNTETSCTVSGSSFTFAVSDDQTFTADHKIRIEMTSISNPQWGFERDGEYWDEKYEDTFGSFDGWSNRFEIAIIDTGVDSSVVAKSYGVLNAGYVGYTNSAISADINEYDPQTDDSRIRLYPGTQSGDLEIVVDTSFPLKSKSLVFTPTTNSNYPDSGNLAYTSAFHSWKVWQMRSSITFRVAAKSTTSKGLYYIDWATTEVKQTGVTDNIYNAPVSILVEVCDSTSSVISVTVGTVPATLYKGYTSIPISVTLGAAPASDLTVSLSFGTSTGISANPTSLKFEPDVDVLYFEIVVSSTYDSAQASPVLTLTPSGTDSAAYITPGTKTITVSSSSSTASAATVTLTPTVKSGTLVSVSATSTQHAVLYWALTCYGAPVPTFTELKAKTADLVTQTNGTYTLTEQLKAQYAATETDIDTTKDTGIDSFFRRIHGDHCATIWTSAQVVYASQASNIDLHWLMAGTKYTLIAYVDNRLTTDTSSYTHQASTFSTSDLPSAYTYAVVFTGTVAETTGDSIRNALAKSMGINPSWIFGQDYLNTPATARMLAEASTSFTYNVAADRSTNVSPSDIVAGMDRTTASADLKAVTGSEPTSMASAAVAAGSAPSWVSDPTKSTVGDSTATFTATSTQNGLVCVSCTANTSSQMTYSWQVLAGLDAENEIAYGACATGVSKTNTTLSVSGLAQGTPYSCFFTACNDYPLWPLCIESTATENLAKVAITTTTPGNDDSSLIMTLAAAFFLIFN